MKPRQLGLGAAVLLVACGVPLPPSENGGGTPADETPAGSQGGFDAGASPEDGGPGSSVDAGVAFDTSLAGLSAFVQSGAYTAWSAESASHPSAGPHGRVRTFVNPVLRDSLEAGASVHPPGSVAVKELYNSAGTVLTGRAVNAKDPATGEWVFYEGFAPSYDDFYFRGTANFCANCHAAGVDYVRTPAAAFP